MNLKLVLGIVFVLTLFENAVAQDEPKYRPVR